MPITVKLLFLLTSIWSGVYSLSYTLYQLKRKCFTAALTTSILTVLMLAVGIFTLWFRKS